MAGRKPSVSPKEVIQAMALHPEPVVTPKDIHEDLGLTSDGARERMNSLAEEGYLEKKKVGSSAVVYWFTDTGRDLLSDI